MYYKVLVGDPDKVSFIEKDFAFSLNFSLKRLLEFVVLASKKYNFSENIIYSIVECDEGENRYIKERVHTTVSEVERELNELGNNDNI